MTLLGERGLRTLAEVNHANAVMLAEQLAKLPHVEVVNEHFFNEISIRVKGDATKLVDRLAHHGIMAGVPAARLFPDQGLEDVLIIANTEVNTNEDRAALVAALKEAM